MSSSTAAPPSKVSFIVRRPTPAASPLGSDSESKGGFKVPALPRRITESIRPTSSSPLARGAAHARSQPPRHFGHDNDDSSDEDKESMDELVTDFDHQRLNGKKENGGPMVIAALANRDWREVSRKRMPVSKVTPAMGTAAAERTETTEKIEVSEVTEETEDEKAMRALIAEATGKQETDDSLLIELLPDERQQPMTDADAYRRDVVALPDEATLDDYERVPVEQFGAALLRGMGWKPGQAASRTRKGLVEPYLPQNRPSLLGLGAKERVVPDDGSGPKKRQKPDRRYVPLAKKERGDKGGESASSSRRSSRSPSRRDDYRNRDGERERDTDKDSGRDRRRDYRERDRDRDRGDDRRDRRDRDYDDDRYRDREGRR